MSVTTTNVLAKVAISKNLIKEYKTSESERTVYLDNGTEFQIYIKNPYQSHLGIDIYVNDKSIGNRLVLRPGQSVWLERYLDNDSKFLFSTYEVEDSAEMHYAINKNGRVRVQFYHEREEYKSSIIAVTNPNITWGGYDANQLSKCLDINFVDDSSSKICTNSDTVLNCASDIISTSANFSTSCNNSATLTAQACAKRLDIDTAATKATTRTMETGRIEKGSRSDQKFETCDIKFEYYSFATEDILILPNSRKQIKAEDTRRRYCTQCGKKVGPKDKFCSNCGAKIK